MVHALVLIRVASLMVPRNHRRNWRAEWEAETWHASRDMRARFETPAFVRWQLLKFALGSFADAGWHLRNRFDREDAMRSPSFCLGAIAALITFIVLVSGGLQMTRAILMPLPYTQPERVATVAQDSISMSSRAGIRMEWIGWWQAKSKLLDGVATYGWSGETARVSDNFFDLLGARTASGRLFRRGDAETCGDCVVLSAEYARRHPLSPYRVIGVLEGDFWFLSRHISVWSLAKPADFKPDSRTGVVIRLGQDVTVKAARHEMESILQDADLSPWSALVDITLIHERVHSVFGSFALGLTLAVVMAFASIRPTWPRFDRRASKRVLFFTVKTVLLLIAVLLAGLEFTRAPSITMTGGTDLLTEPLTTWLYLLASMGVLTWSIYDQRRRCRVCLRRLGLAAHVGCPGCVLLNWAGTELVCTDGHGMLHVPEMVSSWQDPDHWTLLDESWLDLFAPHS